MTIPCNPDWIIAHPVEAPYRFSGSGKTAEERIGKMSYGHPIVVSRGLRVRRTKERGKSRSLYSTPPVGTGATSSWEW